VSAPGLRPHGDPPAYFTFAGLSALGVPHATTTRHFPGVSSPSQPTAPFRAEAAALLAEAGLDPARVAYARQLHGADVAVAPPRGGLAGPADVILTSEASVPLAIFTADCLALTLYDPQTRALAVVHAGWRGTARGAAAAAVSALVGLGARAERLRVAISPSIGPCCYEVDAPVVDAFARAYPDRWQPWFTRRRPGHFMLDLWSANESSLFDLGVVPEHVENARLCTACHPELLYSYRKGNRGRLVTVAAVPERAQERARHAP
jgi:hypothetical protein